MKKINSFILILMGFFIVSCQSVSPDKFFETVILNTNHISDFVPEVFGKRLNDVSVEYPDIPSSKKEGNEATQIVEMKIFSIEKAIVDINETYVTDEDAIVLKEKSIELFETVLPVYKNEYTEYAKLCDTKDSEEDKQAILQKIQNQYMPKVDALFNELYTLGKSYSDKHQLNVNWGK